MELPTMHHILNVVEDMLRESCHKEEDWDRLSMQLYTPDRDDPNAEGWDQAAQDAAFDAFLGAVGG